MGDVWEYKTINTEWELTGNILIVRWTYSVNEINLILHPICVIFVRYFVKWL